LGKFASFVDEILSTDEQSPPKQRHTAMRIFERLKADGYQGRRLRSLTTSAISLTVNRTLKMTNGLQEIIARPVLPLCNTI